MLGNEFVEWERFGRASVSFAILETPFSFWPVSSNLRVGRDMWSQLGCSTAIRLSR
jgi:hypothetical protein